jgi:hypothetical protein
MMKMTKMMKEDNDNDNDEEEDNDDDTEVGQQRRGRQSTSIGGPNGGEENNLEPGPGIPVSQMYI